MSTGEATMAAPLESRVQPGELHPALRFIERSAPKQGWDTLLLLLAALAVVVWTVMEADWVDTPGLPLIVGSGAIAALLLSRVKAPWPLLQLAGLGIAILVVVWQATSLIPDKGPIDQLREFWERMSVWYEAAVTGGISTDLMPFTLIMLTAGWLLGFMSSWFLFRLNNVWVAAVLPAVALLTNLSFLPDNFASRFFLFMLFTMLLVARMSLLQRHEYWRKASVSFSLDRGWWSFRSTIALSVIVLALAAVLPLRVFVSRTAADVWDTARSPVELIEDEFARLFSGVPSRKELAGRFFGNTLPFQGKISFDGDTVLWATSEIPTYWLSRVYSEYSSKGWIGGDTRKVPVGPGQAPPPPQESFKRLPVNQSVQLGFNTSDLFTGGHLQWVSRAPDVEILQPKQFEIDLSNPSKHAEFPTEVQVLAAQITHLVNGPPSVLVESEISRLLPPDMVLEEIFPKIDGGSAARVERVTLVRKEPLSSDVVSWEFIDDIEADESYSMGTLVSNATDRDLRESGTNYSGFVRDHYLQLPSSLPARVVELARDLTADADTPLDKAFAVQSYLRADTYEYSQDIDAPPRGADGVDHFLFETKTGYSDYYASSMAVMLRAVGVPARLAAGYAPGALDDETGTWAVLDSDSHGWTQVYFPGHGWIDFEPTSKWPIARRGADDPDETDADEADSSEFEGGSGLAPSDPCETLADLSLVEDLCPDDLITGGADLEQLLAEQAAESASGSFPILPIVIVLAVLAGVWALVQLTWTTSLAHASHVEKLYAKMGRLGTLAGYRRNAQQTPIEYANSLGGIPSVGPGALAIAGVFSASRYGRAELTEEDRESLTDAWKSVRSGLVVRTLKRIVTLGSA